MAARFTHLTLKSWRNFKDVDVDLHERVFVVGPNASGKSNLLDVFRFLKEIAEPGGSLVRAVESRQGLRHIRSLHARQQATVHLEVEVAIDDDPGRWRYVLEIAGSERKKGQQLRIAAESVSHGTTIVAKRSGVTESDERLATQTSLEQATLNRDFRPLVDALASVALVHVVPQVARSTARTEAFTQRDAPGSDFIDQIAQQTDAQQKRSLARIGKLLRVAVPKFVDLAIERDRLGRPHLTARYTHWRPNAGWQSELDFSDGTLRLIGLLWAIDHGIAPLILEEPELSLHREVIKQLPRLFVRAAARTKRQVIVSTHAEEMLVDKGIEPREVLILEPSENETRVTTADVRTDVVEAAEAGVPLGEIVTALTRPKEIEQLSLMWQEARSR